VVAFPCSVFPPTSKRLAIFLRFFSFRPNPFQHPFPPTFLFPFPVRPDPFQFKCCILPSSFSPFPRLPISLFFFHSCLLSLPFFTSRLDRLRRMPPPFVKTDFAHVTLPFLPPRRILDSSGRAPIPFSPRRAVFHISLSLLAPSLLFPPSCIFREPFTVSFSLLLAELV